MKNTIKISIHSDEELQNILIAELEGIGFYAFEQTDNQLHAFIGDQQLDESTLSEIVNNYGLIYQKTMIKEENWNALWESNFQPVWVNNFCSIRADFHEPIKDVDYDIIITPKMSFGTGHHSTTHMMVNAMQHIDFKNKSVADFGTGTGILAILAEKLGAVSIDAVDYDEWSIENAKENISINNCKHIHLHQQNYFGSGKNYDIILANINRNVIADNAENMSKSLSNSGFLLLSGLLTEDGNYIVEIFLQYKFLKINTFHRNGWVCILLQLSN